MIDYRKDVKWTVYVHIVPKELSGYEWDKYYVGITSNEINIRWKNGHGYDGQPYFKRAIDKYGWKNIKHEIIAEHLTKKEAQKFEIQLINLLQSNDGVHGYNISNGGEGNSREHCSEETKRKISTANKGRIISEETRRKLSESVPKGKDTYNAKSVYQFSLDKIFIRKYDTINEASSLTNVPRQNISKVARHEMIKTYGYLWFFEEDVELLENTYIVKYDVSNRINGKFNDIYCFSPDGSFLKKYDSVSDASKETGVSISSINDCARNKYKTAKKYIWRRINDVEESTENVGSFLIKERM